MRSSTRRCRLRWFGCAVAPRFYVHTPRMQVQTQRTTKSAQRIQKVFFVTAIKWLSQDMRSWLLTSAHRSASYSIEICCLRGQIVFHYDHQQWTQLFDWVCCLYDCTKSFALTEKDRNAQTSIESHLIKYTPMFHKINSLSSSRKSCLQIRRRAQPIPSLFQKAISVSILAHYQHRYRQDQDLWPKKVLWMIPKAHWPWGCLGRE